MTPDEEDALFRRLDGELPKQRPSYDVNRAKDALLLVAALTIVGSLTFMLIAVSEALR